MASEDERKKKVMEHIARSTGKFFQRSAVSSSSDRKQQVMDHIRRTRG